MRKVKIAYIFNFICLVIIFVSNILNYVYKVSKCNKYIINVQVINNNNYKENLTEINNLNVFNDFKDYEKKNLNLKMFFFCISFISCGYVFLQQMIPSINAIVCDLFYSILNYVCIIFNIFYGIISFLLILKINKVKKVDKNINNVMNNDKYNDINWENYGNLKNKCELNIILNIIIIIFCIIISLLCVYGLINIEYRYSDKGRKEEEASDISNSQK